MDLGTTLKEDLGVFRKLKKGSFTGDKFVKEIKGTSYDFNSVFMISSSLQEDFVFFFSDGNGDLKGGFGVNLVLFVGGEIIDSFGEGVTTSSVMDISSFKSILSFSDFTGSEFDFISAVYLLDSPHLVMFSLFGTDLGNHVVNGVQNGGEWSTT